MPRKATVVFIQVPVSSLDELAIALTKQSDFLTSCAISAASTENEEFYNDAILSKEKISRILKEVRRKQRDKR